MQLFAIYFSTMTFLLIELIGLLKGEPVGAILLKSVSAFVVLFSLGWLLSKAMGEGRKKAQGPEEESAPALRTTSLKEAVAVPGLQGQPQETGAASQEEIYKQEAIRLAREKPKEVAQMFEVMINK